MNPYSVVSYKREYVHEVLVNCLVKPAQEKVWLDSDRPDIPIAVNWDIKNQTKPTNEPYSAIPYCSRRQLF